MDELEFNDDEILDNNVNDPTFDLSYKIFLSCFDDQFKNASKIDSKLANPVTFKSKTFQQYLNQFNNFHSELLSTRSSLVRELYLMHHTSKAMFKYNQENLNMSYILFRSHFYFPNIIYLLIRFLPELRQFIQKSIRSAYTTIQKSNKRLVYVFENTICVDDDVMKTDILYRFLGNSMRKLNPLDIQNINAFYKQVFLHLFFYYFKNEQKLHSKPVEDWMQNLNFLSDARNAPTREGLYRDVLTNLQVETYRDASPTMRQLHYNFQIFKNVIIGNEFQSIFLTSQPSKDNSIFCNLNNSQYKILSFYDKILGDEAFILELKKLPLIYKLLKSVHLVTKKERVKVGNVRKEVVISAMEDELALPFKNMLNSDISIRDVLRKIAENFVNSIMSGEYISLQTLAPINFDSISFVSQLRKFIKVCLSHD